MIFDWPRDLSWRPASGSFSLMPITHHSLSPYTGSGKHISLTQIWRATIAWPAHSLSNGIDIEGFLDNLEGGANLVRMFDPWRTTPKLAPTTSNTWSDGTLFDDGTGWQDGWSPAVLYAGSKGDRTVSINGLPVSQACLSRGDLMEINGSIYEVRFGASSNSAGQSLVSITPGLRAAVAPYDVVNLYFPSLSMRLENFTGGLTRNFNWSEGFTLSFVEDIP